MKLMYFHFPFLHWTYGYEVTTIEKSKQHHYNDLLEINIKIVDKKQKKNKTSNWNLPQNIFALL